jgi:PAS domain S-box-containing protein
VTTPFVALVCSLNRRRASEIAGFAASTIAIVALVGLWADLPMLSSWGSGFSAERPLGALGLAAFGLVLIHPGTDSRFAFAVGVAVAAIAAFGLVLVAFDIELGINRWLAPRASVPPSSFQAASAGLLTFGLAGGSLALSRFQRYRLTATLLAGLAGAGAGVALLGYLTGVDTVYGSVSINSPPLPATLGLLCVAAGIISRVGTLPVLRNARPLWHLLVMLGCAIVAPLLLFGVYAGFRVADVQFRQVQENLTIEAGTLSANVDREVIGEIERLQALAASLSLRQGDFAEFQRQAEAALGFPQSGNIVLIDRKMLQLVNTRVPFGNPLPESVIPEPIARSFATGKPQVTDLFMVPTLGQLSVDIIVPVQIGGENRYVVARTPDQHTLTRLVAANELATGWHAVVSDAAHRIISRSEEGLFVGVELPPPQWRRAAPGVFEFVDAEGRPSLQASTRSALTGWETAVWAPKALLEAPVRALWRTLGVMALLALVLVVALALWVGRIIARSVGQAAGAAIALDEGPTPPSGTPVAEVNTLMAELREAAAKRRAAEDWRRQSEAIFHAMFDVSSVGKIEVDPQTAHILRANAAMCKIVGYSEAELLGMTVIDITHPDDRDRSRALGDRQAAGESVDFDIEKRYIHKDGHVVWAWTTVNVIPDTSGRPWRQTTVVQNITARKRAEHELQASKDRLQLAFDATQLGWWQYDPLRQMGSGDSRFKEIFDVTANEISIEDLMRRVHPHDAQRFWMEREAALDPANPNRSVSEFRIRRRNGEVRWLEAHRLAYFEGAGPERRVVSFGGTVQDVTERKEREEKEHLLMREINHRSKNLLSVVDAIAHQTAARNPADFVERFSERIQALSANQDLLVRNEWNGVDIEELVRAQLALFVDLIGSRIAVHGPELRLTPASAQAIGLALHELATNAGKYGALSTTAGRVDICWSIDGDALAMSWTEREGPPVSAPGRHGFGTVVMQAMAERSVGGKVDLDYAPSGLTWRLACPAANALESREPEPKFQGKKIVATSRAAKPRGEPPTDQS